MQEDKYFMYSDGGSRGNPGHSACAFFIFKNNSLLDFGGVYLGIKTNNFAEYSGLLIGLEYCKRNRINKVDCILDSELVVKQLNGEYKIKNLELKNLFEKISDIKKYFSQIKFLNTERKNNIFADKLVNIILDTQT